MKRFEVKAPPVLALATDTGAVTEWLRPVGGESLTLRTVGVGQPEDATLVPFYDVHHQRYSVYWELVPPSDQ